MLPAPPPPLISLDVETTNKLYKNTTVVPTDLCFDSIRHRSRDIVYLRAKGTPGTLD